MWGWGSVSGGGELLEDWEEGELYVECEGEVEAEELSGVEGLLLLAGFLGRGC